MLLAIGLILDLSYVYFFPEYAARKHVSADAALGIQVALVTSWAMCAFGAFLLKTGTRQAGFLLVVLGSLLFFPLGLAAILGAYRLKPTLADSDLSLRRKALMKARHMTADKPTLQQGTTLDSSLHQGKSQAAPTRREYV